MWNALARAEADLDRTQLGRDSAVVTSAPTPEWCHSRGHLPPHVGVGARSPAAMLRRRHHGGPDVLDPHDQTPLLVYDLDRPCTRRCSAPSEWNEATGQVTNAPTMTHDRITAGQRPGRFDLAPRVGTGQASRRPGSLEAPNEHVTTQRTSAP